MKKPRKPKWHELNVMTREGVEHLELWMVARRDREVLVIVNRKTGAVRELPLGGKEMPKVKRKEDSISEYLARGLRRNDDEICDHAV